LSSQRTDAHTRVLAVLRYLQVVPPVGRISSLQYFIHRDPCVQHASFVHDSGYALLTKALFYSWSFGIATNLDWLDLYNCEHTVPAFLCRRCTYLEVEGYQREDQSLQVLDEIVEDAKTFWVRRVLHILERADLSSLVPVSTPKAGVSL
jgi:hypothetical protein